MPSANPRPGSVALPFPLWLETHVQASPEAAPRLVDALAGGESDTGVAGLVEVLAVGLVQQVVDAGAELEVLAHAVGRVEREHAEAAAFVEVLAGHVALPLGHPVLRRHHTPQARRAPVAAFVGQAQAGFQWRDLRHGTLVGGVFTPGVGQAGLGFPVVGLLVAYALSGIVCASI